MRRTNRIYRLFWPGNYYERPEDVCWVVAPTPGKAKSIAMRVSDKAQQADFLSLYANIDQTYEAEYSKWPNELGFDIDQEQHLYDAYTYRDHQNDLLREYWADV